MCKKLKLTNCVLLKFQPIILIVALVATILVADVICTVSEVEMINILNQYDLKTKELCNAQAKGNWNAQTDVGNTDKEKAQVNLKI